ncbi:MAG: ammonia-forming cytochrome c nitrite reductase subunit c552 [Planctomycetaceae bacterium]|nr:MAG: ammonia-forming cytochrome c nitrite reductase subunit c552 [Planctomycetaceae bacterium]
MTARRKRATKKQSQTVADKPVPQPKRPFRWPARIVFTLVAVAVISGSLVFADWWRCLPDDVVATYVGSHSCIECHQDYYELWRGSHHDLAMNLATPETVLGDFDDVHFEHHGIHSRLFRRDGKYMVHTEGPDGQMDDFEIQWVFGVTPLQQYMVEFDRTDDHAENEVARVQVLRITWDTERREWFYLPPPDVKERLAPDDDLHWTGVAQRWNNMCAYCHSTNLQKNYDHDTAQYRTTWSEINVGCEACHGPGSVHVDLANQNSLFWDRKRGFGLVDLKSDPQIEIETCAPCHSRRRYVHPGFLPGDNYYDHFANELIERATYFADGQVLDENYVYGSFIQSKMFHKGIRCTDCHDPHTTRTIHEGNAVCTSCHEHPAGKYDTPAHHFHEPGTLGASCVECHMPKTTYMEVDPRRDHSIRNPRPDLSVALGVPNACTQCHLDTQAEGLADRDDLRQYLDWMLAARDGDPLVQQELARVDAEMNEAYQQWYGEKTLGPREKPHFSHAVTLSRQDDARAVPGLVDIATDARAPGIIRATAMLELGMHEGRAPVDAARRGLGDSDPQVRATAISTLQGRLAPRELAAAVVPLLDDPVRVVRAEAARVLATVPERDRPPRSQQPFERALSEFHAGLMMSNDRAAAHMTWGIVQENLGDDQQAIEAYETAMRVEPGFAGPRTNLAAVYDRLAEAAEARQRQAALARRPSSQSQAAEAAEHYREQARQLRAQELVWIERDAGLVPDNAAIQYRYGMLLYLHRRLEEAEQALWRAHQLEPHNPQFLLGVVLFYQEVKDFEKAFSLAEELVKLRPEDQMFQQILRDLQRRRMADVPLPSP